MNPENQSDLSGQDPSGPGFCLDDAYYIFFRRKWLLLGFTCLGAVAAFAVWFVKPPRYESKAKLMVQYIADTKVNPDSADNIKPLDYGAESLIKSEVEIIYSLDVAAQVADEVKPERILARLGGGNDRMAAANVIRSGIEVEPPRSTVITIVYRHQDKEVVQPVLRSLIDKYMDKHREVHQGGAEKEAYFAKQRDELRKRLEKTEEELKKFVMQAKGMSVADARKTYLSQIELLYGELNKAQADLAEANAVLGDLPKPVAGGTNSEMASVPPDKVEKYTLTILELESLRKQEREYLFNSRYTLQHPQVINVQAQIKKFDDQKSALEREFPALTSFRPMTALAGNNSLAGVDIASEIARRRLTARVEVLGMQLSNIQSEATSVIALEPIIARYQREREQEEKEYHYYLNALDHGRVGDNGGNMSVVQHPTPPGLDIKKAFKLVGVAFGGCVGLGLALAFLLDFVMDRTIKRSVEVGRHLHLPLLISIPDTRWNGRLRLTGRRHHHRSGKRHGSTHRGEPAVHNGGAVVRWDSRASIQLYANGLRERLITYFEGNGPSHSKPRRVAVTSCNHGAGVTTVANSLASALSRIPNVKVLLVDMNIGHGVARSFRNGEACTAADTGSDNSPLPDSDVENDSAIDTLAVVPMRNSDNGHSSQDLPTGLAHLAPQFEANDHDFIIFDLPPASPTSMTPRLAGYMDIVLLVLESEKTGRQTASHASELMKNSRANVAAVLNKYRKYVPERLAPEF